MVALTKRNNMFQQRMADLRLLKEPEKIIAFYRKGLLFAFNFHPSNSLTNVLVPVPNNADYTVKLCSDDEKYGGQNLVEHMTYPAKEFNGQYFVELYLPARTAVVLREGAEKSFPKKEKAPAKKTATKKATAKTTKKA
jgi:1,4-alpha-glucan branching enzyme